MVVLLPLKEKECDAPTNDGRYNKRVQWLSPLLLFFSFPIAQEEASFSLLKKISTVALVYPDQFLSAEQYARCCEYQNTPDPSISSTICK